MAVTIHFDGRLHGPIAYRALIRMARHHAARRRWRVRPIAGFADAEPPRGIAASGGEDAEAERRGLVVLVHPHADPLTLAFGRDFRVAQSVRTHCAPLEVHVSIVETLRHLAPCFAELHVHDEGGFWASRDRDVLRAARAREAATIDRMSAEQPRAMGALLRMARGHRARPLLILAAATGPAAHGLRPWPLGHPPSIG